MKTKKIKLFYLVIAVLTVFTATSMGVTADYADITEDNDIIIASEKNICFAGCNHGYDFDHILLGPAEGYNGISAPEREKDFDIEAAKVASLDAYLAGEFNDIIAAYTARDFETVRDLFIVGNCDDVLSVKDATAYYNNFLMKFKEQVDNKNKFMDDVWVLWSNINWNGFEIPEMPKESVCFDGCENNHDDDMQMASELDVSWCPATNGNHF